MNEQLKKMFGEFNPSKQNFMVKIDDTFHTQQNWQNRF